MVTFADRTSAAVYRSNYPITGGGINLKALKGDDILRPVVCTTFVPDDRGQTSEGEDPHKAKNSQL